MATYRCPGCGAPYNGRRCRRCYYEHFTNEASCEVHSHAGPSVDVELERGRPRRNRRPKQPVNPARLMKWGVSLVVIANLLIPLSLGREHFSFRGTVAPEPAMERIALPEGCAVLYEADGLQVLADWQLGQQMQENIPIYVQNDTGVDLVVTARDVILGDFLMNDAFLFCEAKDGSISMDALRLSAEEWQWADGDSAETLQFVLSVWDQDNYETLLESEPVILRAAPAAAQSLILLPVDGLMYTESGISVVCLGYRADEYSPEDVTMGTLQFHLENNTDRTIQLWTPEATLNGTETHISLWYQLPPHTRTVVPMYLYDLAEMGPLTEEALADLKLRFAVSDAYGEDFNFLSELIPLKLP